MRYLGLDIGHKRIGIAVGNSEARIATPLGVIERRTLKQDAERILEFIRQYEVEALVVGLPRHSDNTESDQSAATRAYVAQLQPLLGLPVHFFDERFSTAAALAQQRERQRVIAQNTRPRRAIAQSEKHGRAMLDAAAAAVILQDFLDEL